jgi:hypothetical protein
MSQCRHRANACPAQLNASARRAQMAPARQNPCAQMRGEQRYLLMNGAHTPLAPADDVISAPQINIITQPRVEIK